MGEHASEAQMEAGRRWSAARRQRRNRWTRFDYELEHAAEEQRQDERWTARGGNA